MFLSSLSLAQRQALMCLAHDVVVSDGELTAGEQLQMESLRGDMNLPADFEAHYLPIEGVEQVFDSRRSRVIAIIALVRMAHADGAFEIEEQCLLSDLCRAFDIGEHDFELLQNWVRRYMALEREVRGIM